MPVTLVNKAYCGWLYFSLVPFFVDFTKATHLLGLQLVAITFSYIINIKIVLSWALDFVEAKIKYMSVSGHPTYPKIFRRP